MVMLVAPPALPTHQQRRLHRLRHRVAIRIADYRIVGTAHVPPGNRVDQAVFARRSAFLPVTDASIHHVANDEAVDLPVVLVNVALIDSVTELLAGL